MKPNNKHINQIIEETTNHYLNEKFNLNLRDRVKNGLKGFDVGYDYQNTGKNYQDNKQYIKIVNVLSKGSNLFNRYEKYFNTYKGNSTLIIQLKQYLSEYNNIVGKLYYCFSKRNNLHESISNRIKGFGRGFIKNQIDDWNFSTETQDLINNVNNFNQNLQTSGEKLIKCIDSIVEIYNNEQYNKFIQNITIIKNNVKYLNKYISNIVFKDKENHSNWTDKGYNFGKKMSQLPNKVQTKGMNFINKVNNMADDYQPEDDTPNPFFNKVGQKIKKYAHQYLGDETYNKLKNYTEDAE